MENGERELKSRNRERSTGNGNPKRVFSGNPPDNSKKRTEEKKREQLLFGEIRGSVTVIKAHGALASL